MASSRFARWTLTLALLGTLPACATPEALKTTASDLKPENVRTLIAKSVLRTLAFSAAEVTRAKVINARISHPEEGTGSFSGKPFTAYCVNAMIENPLFPLHKIVSARVRIVRIEDKPVAFSLGKPDVFCDGAGFEPFPELERLSVLRYEQR